MRYEKSSKCFFFSMRREKQMKISGWKEEILFSTTDEEKTRVYEFQATITGEITTTTTATEK
jgi:hypothetical protein